MNGAAQLDPHERDQPVNQTATATGTDVERSETSALPPFPSDGIEAGSRVTLTSLPVDHYGTTVYLKALKHPDAQHAPIVIVHDVGEHADCYERTANAFYERGYSVYLFDWRGHGRSGWQLGHAPCFDSLVKDLLQVAAWARYQENGRAPIILGNGLGALVVMEFTKNYAAFCQAVILCAPCLELQPEMTRPHRVLLKLLSDISPLVRLWSPFSPRLTSHRVSLHPISREDASLSAKFPGVTAALTYELVQAIKRAETRFIEYCGSVLIICPEKDGICSYKKLKKSAALHDDHNVEIVDLANSGHGVFTNDDASRELAIKVVLGWLSKLVVGKASASESL